MSNERLADLPIFGAELIFRNFEGRETDYNRAGDRNFSVVIPTIEQAIELYNVGWNVQIRPKEAATRQEMKSACRTFDERVEWLSQRGELQDALFHLKVSVSYKYIDKQPKIFLVDENAKQLEEFKPDNSDPENPKAPAGISTLDLAPIINCDLTINPSYWSKGGRSGYMAFLKEAYITIPTSPVTEKYRDYK